MAWRVTRHWISSISCNLVRLLTQEVRGNAGCEFSFVKSAGGIPAIDG